MFKKILFAISLVAISVASVDAQVYRWTDNKGRKYVTDAPPPRTAKDSRYYDLRQRDENQSRPLKRKKRPAKNFKFTPVILYTSHSCGANCAEIRKLLTERGVAFTEKRIKDELDEEWLLKQTGEKIVPSVTVGSTIQKGFDPERLNTILTNAGFPKAVAMPENKDPISLDSPPPAKNADSEKIENPPTPTNKNGDSDSEKVENPPTSTNKNADSDLEKIENPPTPTNKNGDSDSQKVENPPPPSLDSKNLPPPLVNEE